MQLIREGFPGKRLRILLLAFLASTALLANLSLFRFSPGIDFYQYWGVGKAQEYSRQPLRDPYADLAQYDKVLTDAVQRSMDPRLPRGRDREAAGGIVSNPALLPAFCLLPSRLFPLPGHLPDIDHRLISWGILFAEFRSHAARFWFLGLAFFLGIIFAPLQFEIQVGNLNSLQLFGLALSLWLAGRPKENGNLTLLHSIAFFCLLVFLTLLKPNLLPATLLLAASLWARRGIRVFAPAALAGAAFGSILITLSCLRFNSWAVWLHWFRFLGGLDKQTLISLIPGGNFAPTIFLSQALGIGVSGISAAMAAGFGVLVALALVAAIPPEDGGLGGWGRAAFRAISDPNLCASAGVLAMLLISPLVWLHYYLITLLPALWLLTRPHWRLVNLAGGAYIFLGLYPLNILQIAGFWWQWTPYFYASNLALLLAGMLAVLAETQTGGQGYSARGASPGLHQRDTCATI